MPKLPPVLFGSRHHFERDSRPGGGLGVNEAVLNKLERRLGRLHAKLRLGIEMDHEAQIFGQGINFFHIENWYSVHSVIRTTLKLMGLHWRGRKNAAQIQVRHNHISMKTLTLRWLDSTPHQRPTRGNERRRDAPPDRASSRPDL